MKGNPELGLLPMTVFILFTGSTRTRIIAADLGRNFYWLMFNCYLTSAWFINISFIGAILLASGIYFFFVCTHLTVVSFFLPAFFQRSIVLLNRNRRMTKERRNVLIKFTSHSLEHSESFRFIDHQWIFLLEVCRLHALLKVVHCAQVFFPGVIDHSKRDCFFHG